MTLEEARKLHVTAVARAEDEAKKFRQALLDPAADPTQRQRARAALLAIDNEGLDAATARKMAREMGHTFEDPFFYSDQARLALGGEL